MTKLIKNLIFILIFCQAAYAYEFKNFQINERRLNQLSAKSTRSNSSEIYNQIENTLNSDYQNIGSVLLDNSLLSYSTSNVKNYKGLAWGKSFANFSLSINREVAPHLFSESWIVKDSLTLNINAKTLISNLKDEGLIEISEDTLAAFAGLSFTRTFETSSFAKSYTSGLSKGFNKLFFAFKYFNAEDVLALKDGEFIKKVDTLVANAGAVANVPVTTGLSISAGAIGKYSLINLISAEGLESKVKISSQKEKALTVGVSASVQLDFFNLLKISLLSYELNYEVKKSNKVTLEIERYATQGVLSSKLLSAELTNVLKGKTIETYSSLSDYVRSSEVRSSKNLTSKYNIFLFGKSKSKKTQSYKIINNGEEKEFYSHTDSSKTYLQTFFSSLFSNILGVSGTRSIITKTLNIQYEKSFENDDVKSSESFSFNLNNDFYARSLRKRKNRNRARNFLSYWGSFESGVSEAIRSKDIKGPLNITTSLNIKKEALDSFLGLKLDAVKVKIKSFCKLTRYTRNCNKRVLRRYEDLLNYNLKHTTINMELFRDFISMVYNYTYKASGFTYFFPKEMVQMNGKLTANTSSGDSFVSYFKSGQLETQGVISSFSNK